MDQSFKELTTAELLDEHNRLKGYISSFNEANPFKKPTPKRSQRKHNGVTKNKSKKRKK